MVRPSQMQDFIGCRLLQKTEAIAPWEQPPPLNPNPQNQYAVAVPVELFT